MTNLLPIITSIVDLISKHPLLQEFFMKIFEVYMDKVHKVSVAGFAKEELKARQTGNTTKIQEILGKKLR